MQTIKDFIKAYSHLTAVETTIVHKDSEGRIYASNEDAYKAIKAGKKVELVDINESALADLQAMGIESKTDANKFVELLNHIYGQGGARKTKSRRNYSDAEKKSMIKSWETAEKAGTSKVNFCRENNITYQTLMKWIKEMK